MSIPFLIWSLAFLRLILLLFRGSEFSDFHMFYDSAVLLKEGLNPYSVEDFKLHETRNFPDSVLPIVFPTLSVLFYPFTLFSIDTALLLFFFLNIMLLWVMFLWGWEGFYNKRCAFSFLILANSLPTTLSLGMGQVSILVAFFLAFIFFKNKWKGLLLGIATAIKYSLTPLYVFIIPYRSMIMAGAVFLGIAFLPYLFGHDLKELYGNYLVMMQEAFTSGENLYQNGGGYNMVNLDFFVNPTLNWLCKLPFIIGFFYRRSLLAASTVTLLVTYHRIYDAVFIVLLLILLVNRFYTEKRWGHVTVISTFLLYFSLPQGILLPLLNDLGSLFREQSWIYLGSFQEYLTIFPLPAFVMVLLASYSLRRDLCIK